MLTNLKLKYLEMETETTSSNNKSSYGLVNAVNRALGGLAKDYNLEVMTARGQQYFIWIIGEGRPQIKKLWNHALSYVMHSNLCFTI
jgi:hypothetical protein